MPKQTPATAIVNDAAGAIGYAGRLVSVRGLARNAKLGAAVASADLVVYCPAIGRWPPALQDRTVQVAGRLEQSNEFAAPAGEISAGTEGPVWILRDCALETH